MCVGLGNGIVDVDQNSGFASAVDAWDSNQGSWTPTAAAGDVDLATGNVELSTTGCGRDVQRDLFDTDKILSAREVLGDGEVDGLNVLARERDARSTIGDSGDLVDFEPNVFRPV